MEQILRVDVSALLKTIQNLENKLSQSPAPVNIPVAGTCCINLRSFFYTFIIVKFRNRRCGGYL